MYIYILKRVVFWKNIFCPYIYYHTGYAQQDHAKQNHVDFDIFWLDKTGQMIVDDSIQSLWKTVKSSPFTAPDVRSGLTILT